MSNENGLTDSNQPLTPEEEAAIFEEIYGNTVGGKETSNRQINKALKDVREENAQAAEQDSTTEVVESAANQEVQSQNEQPQEAANQAANTQEVQVRPEDYQAVLKDLERWKQKASSLDGREAARQRQIAELQAEINRVKQASETPKKDPPQQATKDEDWEALVEVDPTLAKIIQKQFEQREARIREELSRDFNTKMQTVVAPFQQEQVSRRVQQEQAKLREWVPNLDEVLESDAYADWFHKQPEYIQKLVNEDAEQSYFVISKFAHDMDRIYGKAETTSTQTTGAHANVSKLQEQRDKRSNVQAVGSKPVPKPSTESFNPDDEFKKIYEQNIIKRK